MSRFLHLFKQKKWYKKHEGNIIDIREEDDILKMKMRKYAQLNGVELYLLKESINTITGYGVNHGITVHFDTDNEIFYVTIDIRARSSNIEKSIEDVVLNEV